MDNIKYFIDLGWHTVPLRGKLERLEDGKKTLPKFEDGWREKYNNKFNKSATKLGGAVTGQVSGIIAIDCDNTVTYELFKSLDPDYAFEFISEGKKDKEGNDLICATIVYEYDDSLPFTFSIANDAISLDVYSNNGFIYLPTELNKSKKEFTPVDIKPMPGTVKAVLQQFHASKVTVSNDSPKLNSSTGNYLAPLVEQFVGSNDYLSGLFKIITPRDFRKEADYIKLGHLHPDKVPQGRGSEYLSKISAILGADPSISLDLYVSAMHLINGLWDDPMDQNKLDKTICDPMINKKAQINGEVIWKYDEDWKKSRLSIQTKRQSTLELGFDDRRALYYCVELVSENVRLFNRDTDMQSYIEAVGVNPPTRKELKQKLPLLNVVNDPAKSFGFSIDESSPHIRTLNTFIQTPELAILHEPEEYTKYYNRPVTIIKYFESLVPELKMRNYLLSFIKRKLMYFEYSPIILYFLGVQGSGKDTLVSILEQIVGSVSRPTVKEFLEIYNPWLVDAHFVQLDEFGNQLTKITDREEAMGKLKAFTGKSNVQIRQMRTDSYKYNHRATFIMTANKNPLMLEDQDRRIAFFPTPNVLSQQKWVSEAGGISKIHNQIIAEIKDFCYYLATEIDVLSPSEFVTPAESKAKHELIANSMYAAQRIAYVLKHDMIDYLRNLAIEYEAPSITDAIKKKRITSDDMEELYDAMTDMRGEMRTLNKAIRAAGIDVVPTSSGGHKSYYYALESFNDDFEDESTQEENNVKNFGITAE